MDIRDFEGKTREEALLKAEETIGRDYVILSEKTVNAGGLFGFFKKPTYRITISVDEDEKSNSVIPSRPVRVEKEENHQFSAIANEDTVSIASGKAEDNELLKVKEDLQSTFREVGELIAQAENPPVTQGATYDKNAAIIKFNDPARKTDFGKITPGDRPIVKKEPEILSPEPALQTKVTIEPEPASAKATTLSGTNYDLIKTVYNTLIDNEVDERYINDIINEIDNAMLPGADISSVLSNVYQKMLLKLGRPHTITIDMDGKKRPKVVIFIGPTGVGKTTTLAKLAGYFKTNRRNSVALLTTDTYRIKAFDQLKTYAEIIGAPIKAHMIKDEENDINSAIEEFKNNDLVLVDTYGFSYRNAEHRQEMVTLLEQVNKEKYDVSIYLVLSATTKYKDLRAIGDAYKEFTDFDLIFTKLDETYAYGNIFNIKLYSGKSLSYVANGQNVGGPGDLEIVNSQKLVKQLLGGQDA